MKKENITESDSLYSDLDAMSVEDILLHINHEDRTVAPAVFGAIAQIEQLVNVIVQRLQDGGRLFYMGAGTSGRLAVVDASECPPTFGVDHGMVIALIAGGDKAIRYPVEFAEDDTAQGWKDLQSHKISPKDVVIGIAASGNTPYVIGAMKKCNENKIVTGCITCNRNTVLRDAVDYPIEVIVGPEFVTGSTRMKSGTAQKLVLNMISTSVMIRLGRVKGNKMVDMQLSNKKLLKRGTNMVMSQTGLQQQQAEDLLIAHGSVRKAVGYYLGKNEPRKVEDSSK